MVFFSDLPFHHANREIDRDPLNPSRERSVLDTMTNAALTVVGMTAAPSRLGANQNPERYAYQVSFSTTYKQTETGWCFGKTPEQAADNAVNDVVSKALAYRGVVVDPASVTDIYLVQG